MRRSLLVCAPIFAACVAHGSGERLGTAQQANVCASGATLEGVDVSVYDGDVDWTQVKSSGRAFGIAKATEGASFTDAEFAVNWPAMKGAGIVRSAYHFFHCDSAPATQASFFLGVLGALEPGDLPPSLDFEDTTTCPAGAGVSMAIEWLDAVASETGTLPILYTSVNVLSQFDDVQSLAGHAQLWVASRGVTCPDLPTPFTAWSFWQYSLTGTAKGLPNSDGMADLDQFNGDLSALLALTVGGSSTSASSSASSSSGAPACLVGGVTGRCLDTSVCAMMSGYVSTPGLCPGPDDEQCCTPAGDASSGSCAPSSSASGVPAGGVGGAATSGVGGAAASSGGPTPSTSSGCAATPTGATTSRSVLSGVLLLAGVVASSRKRARVAPERGSTTKACRKDTLQQGAPRQCPVDRKSGLCGSATAAGARSEAAGV